MEITQAIKSPSQKSLSHFALRRKNLLYGNPPLLELDLQKSILDREAGSV